MNIKGDSRVVWYVARFRDVTRYQGIFSCEGDMRNSSYKINPILVNVNIREKFTLKRVSCDFLGQLQSINKRADLGIAGSRDQRSNAVYCVKLSDRASKLTQPCVAYRPIVPLGNAGLKNSNRLGIIVDKDAIYTPVAFLIAHSIDRYLRI